MPLREATCSTGNTQKSVVLQIVCQMHNTLQHTKSCFFIFSVGDQDAMCITRKCCDGQIINVYMMLLRQIETKKGWWGKKQSSTEAQLIRKWCFPIILCSFLVPFRLSRSVPCLALSLYHSLFHNPNTLYRCTTFMYQESAWSGGKVYSKSGFF